jgi:ATP-binding cassette subfamily C protein CydD
VQTLISLRLISRSNSKDLLDNPRLKCNATFEFIQKVADNLRLGDPVADVVEMRRALDAAGLGLALDRTVGDGGDELSAGERRRLAMARALLRRADLVVLDEATAGLDAVSEASIVRAARAEADRGAAVLMVAHRPAALAGADRVVVLG